MSVVHGILAGTTSGYPPGPTIGLWPMLGMLAVLVVPAVALIATIVHTNRSLRRASRRTPTGLGETTLQEELWRFLDDLERGGLELSGAPRDNGGEPRPDRRGTPESEL